MSRIDCCGSTDFYPRPPRGGRLSCHALFAAASAISIHALREEGDKAYTVEEAKAIIISIHALREEGDQYADDEKKGMDGFLSTPSARRATGMVSVRKRQHEFLSTPSARRATARPGPSTARHRNFYPRPPRGGRRKRGSAAEEYSGFLSTPSARRATRAPQGTGEGRKHFYPRPPRGGRRHLRRLPDEVQCISIHALREEGDSLPV